MSVSRATPPTCPVCGEDVPPRALACPECGADERSGWRKDALSADGLDLPGDFDYDDFVRNEFGSPTKPKHLPTLWWVTALILAIAFAYLLLHGIIF